MILIAIVISLLLFNSVFFVTAGTDNTASVWISYAFIHLAALAAYGNSCFCRGIKDITPNLAIPLNSVSFGYFVVEFVVGGVFCILSLDGYKFAFITQLVILAVFSLVYFLMLFNVKRIVKK